MTVEMIDYIFDRYEYLGLGGDVPVKDIREALKRRRAENHPDRLMELGLTDVKPE